MLEIIVAMFVLTVSVMGIIICVFACKNAGLKMTITVLEMEKEALKKGSRTTTNEA